MAAKLMFVGSDRWTMLRASNRETRYGWGTLAEAATWADALDEGREYDLYGVYDQCEIDPEILRSLNDGLRDDGVNLSDELDALLGDEGTRRIGGAN